MATRTQIFAFDLNEPVLIREVQRPGKIEALTIDFLGVQYRVVYWDDGDRKSVWLQEDELSSRVPERPRQPIMWGGTNGESGGVA